MSSKRKGRSSAASQSSNQSPEEKRSKNSETDEVFEALEMAEDVGLKLQRVLDKLEKLDKIEAHLSEVSTSLAGIEEKVSRFEKMYKTRSKKKTEWKRKCPNWKKVSSSTKTTFQIYRKSKRSQCLK